MYLSQPKPLGFYFELNAKCQVRDNSYSQHRRAACVSEIANA